MPADSSSKKLYYDGDRLYVDINLGNLTYFNSKGAVEQYEANRVELHFPSEHYITIDGQTPRYALELQIHHTLKKSSNMQATNSVTKINQASVSILFAVGDLEEGDMFLNALGINKYNINNYGKFNIPSSEQFILRSDQIQIPASYSVGFNYLAFQGLLNLINADRQMFYYYGSETFPPCKEDVLWMIFTKPRSISKPQFDYLLLTLARNKDEKLQITDAKTPNMLYGNKRGLVIYDETSRGKILYNPSGLKHVHNKAFFTNSK